MILCSCHEIVDWKTITMTAICTNLDSLILDVFYLIASQLDCDDYVYLSRVSQCLKKLL
jgi:hypothetical protein